MILLLRINKKTKSEINTRILQRRGIWSIKDIKSGEKFTRDNIKILRPAYGLNPSKFINLLEKYSSKNYKAYEPIKFF